MKNYRIASYILFAACAVAAVGGIVCFSASTSGGIGLLAAAVLSFFLGYYFYRLAKNQELQKRQAEERDREAEERAKQIKEDAEYFAPVVADYDGKSLTASLGDYVVIDLETTGLNENNDEIIELGAVRVRDGVIVDRFSQLIKPRRTVSAKITAINGISNYMLSDAPCIIEALPAFVDFVGDDVIVGQKVFFDIRFLFVAAYRYMNQRVLRNDYIDILPLSRRLFPGLPNYKLGSIAERCGVKVKGAHRAEADCITTQGCYEYIKKCLADGETELGGIE